MRDGAGSSILNPRDRPDDPGGEPFYSAGAHFGTTSPPFFCIFTASARHTVHKNLHPDPNCYLDFQKPSRSDPTLITSISNSQSYEESRT